MTRLAWFLFGLAGFGTTLFAIEPAPQKLRVAVLLYDGVQILDVAGPLEVFTGTTIDKEGKQQRAFEVYTVAERSGPVTANNAGKTFVPDYTLAAAPQPQILIVPGGDTASAEANAALIAWIRRTSAGTEVTASVCTGAFLLAKAGLLQGKPATTHGYFLDRLAGQYAGVDVKRDVRFVDAGRIVTAAGVSAGIDMALHLVERYHGRDTARRTARVMQYEGTAWAP
ncbi:MAG TPA: DJ-1/PfpI family protein [Candidatus Polarisedimenticolaceae bacterium]|nr:DJ-1/PfpI family protein [Candidatus Polarisedimenticolaceae bacterium]